MLQMVLRGLKQLTRFSQSRKHRANIQSVSLTSQITIQRSNMRPARASGPDKEYSLKLDLETRAIDDVTVLFCKGRFTYRDEARAFSEKIAELLPNARQLVVEFSSYLSLLTCCPFSMFIPRWTMPYSHFRGKLHNLGTPLTPHSVRCEIVP